MEAKTPPLLCSYYHKDYAGGGTWFISLGKCDSQADTGAGLINVVSWLLFPHGVPLCVSKIYAWEEQSRTADFCGQLASKVKILRSK